jgi:hypothetical protein
MKSWGRYELTPAPAGSDLVFQLLFTNPMDAGGPPVMDPLLRLTILDPATHAVLWTFTVHVKIQIGLQAKRDKLFDDAIDSLVADVKDLAARH